MTTYDYMKLARTRDLLSHYALPASLLEDRTYEGRKTLLSHLLEKNRAERAFLNGESQVPWTYNLPAHRALCRLIEDEINALKNLEPPRPRVFH